MPRRALIGVLLAGASLRIAHANADYWFDEIATVLLFVRAPLGEVLTSYRAANNHVLNSALVHAAASLGGEAPWVVRAPAILFGIAGVWAFWFVARQVWPERAALAGTGLFAVSYPHIYYSQNARGYSALVFFALLATGLVYRLVDAGRPPASRAISWAYAVSIGLGLYAMLLMTFVVAGHAVVLAARREWRPLAVLACGVAIAGLCYGPMIPSLIHYYQTSPDSTGHPLLSVAFLRTAGPIALLLAVAALACAPLLWRAARQRPLAVALVTAPIAFNVIVPLLRGQGVYPRMFMLVLPAAHLFLVDAFDWTHRRRPRFAWLGAGTLAVTSLAMLAPYYQLPKQGFRQALAYVDARRVDGEARVGLTLAGTALRYYDPAVLAVSDLKALGTLTRQRAAGVWIVSTFRNQVRRSAPELVEWLDTHATLRASFPGVIGDGTVSVHYWKADGGQ